MKVNNQYLEKYKQAKLDYDKNPTPDNLNILNHYTTKYRLENMRLLDDVQKKKTVEKQLRL